MVTGWYPQAWTRTDSETGKTESGTHWYYFGPSGAGFTGWVKDGGNWYYCEYGWMYYDTIYPIGDSCYGFHKNGVMMTGWNKYYGDWYYFNPSGSMVTGWLWDNNDWYYLDPEDGWMYADDWWKIGDYTYMFRSNGAMLTGWDYYYGDWYYYDADGREHRGWLLDGNKWYYLDPDPDGGYMYYDDIYEINERWYAFDNTGAMLTGWQYYDEYEGWYYFDSDGAGHDGWLLYKGAWYWCEDGVMAADGIVKTGEKWSEFNKEGVWLGYVDSPEEEVVED